MDEIWNKIHSSRVWGGYPSEHVIRFFARNYYSKERSKVTILDFGCGGGAHTWYLAREGFDVYAFDGSEYAVENAKKKLSLENLRADFRVCDGLNADYKENFFDAILDNVCIYANRIDDIRCMYKKARSFLKPGGMILTANFGVATYGFGLGTEIEKGTYTSITDGPLKDRGVAHFYREMELREVLSEAGFQNIEIDRITYTDRGKPIEQLIAQAEK